MADEASGEQPRANAGLSKAWNTILYDKFLQWEPLLTTGLGQHGTRLVDAHPPAAGSSVLDVGCGWGDTTAVLAKLVGAEGKVVGVDIAPRFIEQARERYPGCTFEVKDVEYESELGGPYDAVYARFGTMFFVNPVKGFKNMAGCLKPGGQMHIVVWRKRQDNPVFYTAQQVAERHIAEEDKSKDEVTCGPGPFANAGADMMSDILMKAGFSDVNFCRFDAPMQMGRSVDEAVTFTTTMGPAGESIRLAEAKSGEEAGAKRKQIEEELRAEYVPLDKPGEGVWMNSSTWIITATKK